MLQQWTAGHQWQWTVIWVLPVTTQRLGAWKHHFKPQKYKVPITAKNISDHLKDAEKKQRLEGNAVAYVRDYTTKTVNAVIYSWRNCIVLSTY